MKSHYREDVNAPASAENEVFRTFAEVHEIKISAATNLKGL
jgi:hypothetical protein